MNKNIIWIMRYLKYILRHKRFVWVACFKMWLYRQGLIHDLSKLFPCEFKRYMRYYSMNDKTVKKEFDRAWNHHQKYNPHHWQYWVLVEDGWTVTALEMPKKYVKEMLCDWRGVGRWFANTPEAIKKYEYCERHEVYARYHKNKDKILLHDYTKAYVENFLERQKRSDYEWAYIGWWVWYFTNFYDTEPVM